MPFHSIEKEKENSESEKNHVDFCWYDERDATLHLKAIVRGLLFGQMYDSWGNHKILINFYSRQPDFSRFTSRAPSLFSDDNSHHIAHSCLVNKNDGNEKKNSTKITPLLA